MSHTLGNLNNLVNYLMRLRRRKKMIKADDKVEYDGEKEKYTNFEELSKRVEIMQRVIDELASILQHNNLVRPDREVNLIDQVDDEVYKELDAEIKEPKK